MHEQDGETWPRAALGPGNKPRNWMPVEKFQLYVRGFKDGAAGIMKPQSNKDLPPYEAGYADGRRLLSQAAHVYARSINYKLSPLRGEDGEV